jgi:hypothetical protein
MKASWLTFGFVLFFALTAKTEYRVFSIVITNEKTQVTRQIETTVDPDQYAYLYPLNRDEKITYVDTWRCFGRTDYFKNHCAKPTTVTKLDQKPAVDTSQSPEVPPTP